MTFRLCYGEPAFLDCCCVGLRNIPQRSIKGFGTWKSEDHNLCSTFQPLAGSGRTGRRMSAPTSHSSRYGEAPAGERFTGSPLPATGAHSKKSRLCDTMHCKEHINFVLTAVQIPNVWGLIHRQKAVHFAERLQAQILRMFQLLLALGPGEWPWSLRLHLQ